MSFFRDQLEAWLGLIDIEADSVLDVGGGERSVKDRVKSWKVKDYKILDNDARFKPDIFADINYPLGQKLGGKWQESFDIIFCLEVSEYLFDPLMALRNMYVLLKRGGVLYITFCTIYPLHNPPKIDYLRYTKNAVEKLLSEAGFSTWEITPRIATNGLTALHDFYVNEGMHPMKGTIEIYDIGYCVKAFKNEYIK